MKQSDTELRQLSAGTYPDANIKDLLMEMAAELLALRAALVAAQRMLNAVNSEHAHAAFCNGVHAPDGQCEGMHWLSETEDMVNAALREPGEDKSCN